MKIFSKLRLSDTSLFSTWRLRNTNCTHHWQRFSGTLCRLDSNSNKSKSSRHPNLRKNNWKRPTLCSGLISNTFPRRCTNIWALELEGILMVFWYSEWPLVRFSCAASTLDSRSSVSNHFYFAQLNVESAAELCWFPKRQRVLVAATQSVRGAHSNRHWRQWTYRLQWASGNVVNAVGR